MSTKPYIYDELMNRKIEGETSFLISPDIVKQDGAIRLIFKTNLLPLVIMGKVIKNDNLEDNFAIYIQPTADNFLLNNDSNYVSSYVISGKNREQKSYIIFNDDVKSVKVNVMLVIPTDDDNMVYEL